MKKVMVLCLTFLVVLGVIACEKEAGKVSGKIAWITSFDEALVAAEKKDKPIMIDFYADWCTWCHRLDNDTYSDDVVATKSKDFVNLKIDADASRDLVEKYRIRGLPTVLFLDHKGQEVHRMVGYKPPKDFLKEMDVALQNYKARHGG